jgi:hypothetical protein
MLFTYSSCMNGRTRMPDHSSILEHLHLVFQTCLYTSLSLSLCVCLSLYLSIYLSHLPHSLSPSFSHLPHCMAATIPRPPVPVPCHTTIILFLQCPQSEVY